MVIGSGLLATAMATDFAHREDCLVFASGVSNSHCNDPDEFAREAQRLNQALTLHKDVHFFIYFSTCSVYDPERIDTPYVQHKLKMEKLVSRHQRYLILRLPQLAGKTSNPHTLLNFLYKRIQQDKPIIIWTKARRNIIDCMDVAHIFRALVEVGWNNEIINVANEVDYSVMEIVEVFETILGKTAKIESVERGCAYKIDVSSIAPYVWAAGIRFDEGYLERVLRKYYEKK